MAPAHEDRIVAVRLGAAVALFLLLVGQAQVTVLDGSSMLAVAQSIVHHGTLSVPAPLGVPGDGGLFYSKYGLLLPLLSVVPVALVQPLGLLTGRVDLLEAAGAASLMPLVAGALAGALVLLGRRLGAPPRAAALVAAGTVLGTYVLPYGRDFFTEPLVALGVVAMVERALAGRDAQAATALALAILARPQSAAFVPLLWAFVAARELAGARARDAATRGAPAGASAGAGIGAHGATVASLRAIARTLAPLAFAAALTVAYNLVRFGDPLEFGYRPPVDPGFTTPLAVGTRGLLLSPEKSILLFAPAIVLVPFALAALWRRARATALLLAALFAVTFVLAATWHSWMGGWSWGPRLVLPGVVVVLAALGPWIGAHASRARTAAALFALGYLLSLPAVIAPAGAQLLHPDPRADGPQISRQVREVPHLTRDSLHAVGDRAARGGDYRLYLAPWQAGISRQLGAAGVVLAAVGTIVLLAALLRVAGPLARRLRRA
ncbi:MAG: hypothetical protein QOJ35_1451 [Solirubrobacteraceae bacterium]|jgi:hypothetical protein|nr:hypothetical protein [Solirubrobacteraceae bacterium]